MSKLQRMASTEMKKILAILCVLSLIFSFAACSGKANGNEPSSSIMPSSPSANIASQEGAAPDESTAEMQIYIQSNDGHTIAFQLNESLAAKALYAQLPLDIPVEDYAKSEKVFYPPEKLDIADAPVAEGPAGTLAYYEPWGNVAVFYGECGGAGGLYELGEAISGVEWIANLSGEIHITTLPEANKNQTSDTPLLEDSEASSRSRSLSSLPQAAVSDSVQAAVANDKTANNTAAIPKPTLPPASQAPSPPAMQPEAEADNSMYQIQIVIGEQSFPTVLYKNKTTAALINRLPLTLAMSDMNGNEKYFYFSDSLPTNAERPSEIHAGDFMLYGTDCLVLFYESFSSSYRYTPLGYVEDAVGLAGTLGSGNVQVSFNAE